MSDGPELDEALSRLRDAFDRGVLAKVVLSAPSGGEEGLRSVAIRPVRVGGERRLQLVWRYERRDTTRNQPIDEALATIRGLCPSPFRHLHLHTTERTLQLEWRSRGRIRRSEGPASHEAPPSEAHDRAKRRLDVLDPRWLCALGVTDERGQPRRGRHDKLRQVQRFVEVLDHWLGGVPRPEDGRTRWIDVGCGSGVLTFATWAYLRGTGYDAAEVVGVELRPELAAKIEAVARQTGCDGLSFVAGAMSPELLSGAPVDGVIALHACDTATDDALAAGVAAGARWLLVAPCCHKELRPQLAPPAPLSGMLQHGILRTREAELATDALRAALLEASGYAAKVFEFVSAEHTDKNLMIAAVRRESPAPGAVAAARELAAFYGVRRQRLAERLGIALAEEGDGGSELLDRVGPVGR